MVPTARAAKPRVARPALSTYPLLTTPLRPYGVIATHVESERRVAGSLLIGSTRMFAGRSLTLLVLPRGTGRSEGRTLANPMRVRAEATSVSRFERFMRSASSAIWKAAFAGSCHEGPRHANALPPSAAIVPGGRTVVNCFHQSPCQRLAHTVAENLAPAR
jgi:hypothetical protein